MSPARLAFGLFALALGACSVPQALRQPKPHAQVLHLDASAPGTSRVCSYERGPDGVTRETDCRVWSGDSLPTGSLTLDVVNATPGTAYDAKVGQASAGASPEDVSAVIDWALAMGFAVLAFDLPGHGLSSGVRASIGDFAEYQTVLRAVLAEAAVLDLPQPWHLCGQSTGGAIIIDYLLTGEPLAQIGQTILLAPLVRPRAWGWSKLSYRVMRHVVSEIPRRFSVNSSDAAFIDFVHHHDPLQPRNLPTAWVGALSRWVPHIEAAPRSKRSPLIIQGEADMTVAWRHNLKVLADKFTTPQILRLPEAGHHLANEAPALRQRYFDWLSQRLG